MASSPTPATAIQAFLVTPATVTDFSQSILSSILNNHFSLCNGSFTPSESVTITVMTGKIGMQPMLPITVPVKKITTRQCYVDGDAFVWCEQTLKVILLRIHENASILSNGVAQRIETDLDFMFSVTNCLSV